MAMLEARSVGLQLGGKPILDQVDLSISTGEVVALIGPNGAGKSTLLACLSGALRPSSGSVRIDGDDPAELSAAALASRRSVLDQSPAASLPFRVDELVGLAVPREISPEETRQIVGRALAILGLADLRSRPVTRLSGGERHRAHMARALAQLWAGQARGAGSWLLLDEPTASLDLAHQGAVLEAARSSAQSGAGVLVVLHDLTLAASVADRVALMRAGRIVASGPAHAVLTAENLSPVYGIDLAITEPVPGALAITPLFHHAS